MNFAAILMGGPVRVGLEDDLFFDERHKILADEFHVGRAGREFARDIGGSRMQLLPRQLQQRELAGKSNLFGIHGKDIASTSKIDSAFLGSSRRGIEARVEVVISQANLSGSRALTCRCNPRPEAVASALFVTALARGPQLVLEALSTRDDWTTAIS